MKLREIIEKRIKDLSWTYYKLSKESGVSLTSLYSVKNGVRDYFTLEATVKVFNALKLDLNELNKIDWKKN